MIKHVEELHAVHVCDRCGERIRGPRNCQTCDAEVGLCCIRTINAGLAGEPCHTLVFVCTVCQDAKDADGVRHVDRLRQAVAVANIGIASVIAAWRGSEP